MYSALLRLGELYKRVDSEFYQPNEIKILKR